MKHRTSPYRSFVPFSTQRGRTLVELLVAITLSLMIVAAVGAIYIASSQSARTSLEISSVEERGRMAMFFVGEPIAMAGYGTIVGVTESRYDNLTFSEPHVRACQAGTRFQAPAAGNFNCVAGGGAGDQLMVSYQADSAAGAPQGLLTDCLGQGAPLIAGVPTVRNIYSIAAGQFACQGNGAAQTQGLIDGVEDFKVFLAFDQRSFQTGLTIGNYVPTVIGGALLSPATIAASPQTALGPTAIGNPWNHVVAVYVCVQLRTTEGATTLNAASTFLPCPQNEAEAATGTAPEVITDGVARRSFTRVFTIRSRAQAAAL